MLSFKVLALASSASLATVLFNGCSKDDDTSPACSCTDGNGFCLSGGDNTCHSICCGGRINPTNGHCMTYTTSTGDDGTITYNYIADVAATGDNGFCAAENNQVPCCTTKNECAAPDDSSCLKTNSLSSGSGGTYITNMGNIKAGDLGPGTRIYFETAAKTIRDKLNGTAANATATAGNNTLADDVTTVFNYLDADKDGGLNGTEFKNMASLVSSLNMSSLNSTISDATTGLSSATTGMTSYAGSSFVQSDMGDKDGDLDDVRDKDGDGGDDRESENERYSRKNNRIGAITIEITIGDGNGNGEDDGDADGAGGEFGDLESSDDDGDGDSAAEAGKEDHAAAKHQAAAGAASKPATAGKKDQAAAGAASKPATAAGAGKKDQDGHHQGTESMNMAGPGHSASGARYQWLH